MSEPDPHACPHAAASQAVATALGSGASGLSAQQAAELLATVGPNQLPRQRRSWTRLLAAQFRSVLVYILFAALALSIVTPLIQEPQPTLRSFLDAIVIAAILVVNAGLGFAQEYRAERAIAALDRLTASAAHVRRGGRLRSVPASEVVPGDLLALEAGDRVAADARLVETSFLEVDESALTGESATSPKGPAAVEARAPLAERSSMVFQGTLVTRGSGIGVVTATGVHTETGKIAGLVGGTELPRTPLQDRLARLAALLGVVAAVGCALVLVVGWVRGMPVLEMMLVAVSLAVSAVPEGLPAVVTVCFALGVRRMAEHNALVRRLDALETLGGVTVIASDKTGTLTENRMRVVDAWVAPGWTQEALATALATCSRAELPDQGDPTELALLDFASGLGAERHPIEAEEVPFTSEGRYMQVRAAGRSWAKGAPVRIGELVGDGAALRLRPHVEALAARGLRVLACAVDDGSGPRLAGLVGMEDPPRAGAASALSQARRAGIRTLMITGDNALTARAVAEQVGLGSGRVFTGPQLDDMTPADLERALAQGANVFARASPAHKLAILDALKRRGEVVAMTGDGVNDAPALKGAHVGVAMGKRGTDVAREASSIVLADDHYATLVTAIREGRRIHDNIRKFVLFLLRANFDELLVVFVAVAVGLPLPFLPLHVLWINLLTDSLPALALGTEAAEPDVMERPPRPRSHGLLHGEGVRLGVTVTLTFGATLGFFLYQLAVASDVDHARSNTLTLAIVLELLLALSSRSRLPIWRIPPLGNRWLLAAMATVFALHLVLLYTPLAAAFRVTPLSLAEWFDVLVVAGVTFLVVELSKVFGSMGGTSPVSPAPKPA